MTELCPFIVATAGHIDHGKSTLVEALTGTDPDRLPEEKKRGLTIELGYAHLDLPDPQILGRQYHVGLIDVPGHSDFVRNMVAGVGSIDAAILVVAADDGWMPQTEEHLQILLYLGVTRAVIALTKSDLLERPDGEAAAIATVHARLAGTPLAAAPIVPVCALGGDGLDALRRALTDILRDTPPPRELGRPRLFVDRAFSPRGVGTVVTGTLSGGCFRVGDELLVHPGARPARIRGIQNHGRSVAEARPGMRTALQLHGIEVATDESTSGVHRGDIIAAASSGLDSVEILHVALERSNRAIDGQSAPPPLRTGQKVWFHHGAASIAARLVVVQRRPRWSQVAPEPPSPCADFGPEARATSIRWGEAAAEPCPPPPEFRRSAFDVECPAFVPPPPPASSGECCLAELRLSRPVLALAGDRFVLRDWARRHTLAGGLVLDLAVRRGTLHRPAQLVFLRSRATAPCDPETWVRSMLDRDHALLPARCLLASRFSTDEIQHAVDLLDGTLTVGSWIVAGPWWQSILDGASRAIREHLQRHPEAPGLRLTELRDLVMPQLTDPALFEELLSALTTRSIIQDAGFIRPHDHLPQLPPELKAAADRIRKAVRTGGFNPPPPSELAPTPDDQKALRTMIAKGELIELSPIAVIDPSFIAEVKKQIAAHLAANGRATVSELREALDSSRRIVVPLLERLDREGFTARSGDFRVPGRKGF